VLQPLGLPVGLIGGEPRELYRGYGDFMTLHSADNVRVYRDRAASVVVLEYEVHGESVRTGRSYDNRFVSIVTVRDGKVTHWRDYLDPIAVFDASGWPDAGQGTAAASPTP